MNRMIAVILSIALMAGLFLPETVYSEDVSKVLALYGYKEPLSLTQETAALNKLLKEYYTLSKAVSGIEMSEAAIEIYSQQYPDQLLQQKNAVAEKEIALGNLESKIYKNAEAPVEDLLSLEAEYIKTQNELRNAEQKLIELQEEKSMEDSIPSNIGQMKVELHKKDTVLRSQKNKVEKAAAIPEIGDVQLKQYPLGADSYITSDYGARIDPITKETTQFHGGIDLHADRGTKVICAYNGTVAEVGFDEQLGNYVIVDHGQGLKTMYGHLESYIVKAGDSVMQYQHIAYSGDSGSRTTGPHLHFGIFIGGQHVNPNLIFKK